jgi:ABC-2 type transport system permease protein
MEMRVFSIVVKDLKIYVRQKKTLLLMILCPVLIMLLIGSVFSGAPERGLKGVTLGVAGAETPLGKEIIEGLSREEIFVITQEATLDPQEIERKVRAGEYSAGIVLPANETGTLKLFLDNSKIQVAPVISTVFITMTEKLSFEITLEFIEKLWTSLQEMEVRMDPLGNEVMRVRDSIIGINEDAKQIKDSLDLLNVQGLNASVRQMRETLEDMKGELNQTRRELNTTREEILGLNSTISSINADATELRGQLGIVVENINSTDAALLDLQENLELIYNTTCLNQTLDPRCISILATIDQINDTRALLHNRTSRIISLYDNLGRVAATSEELQSKLADTDARLQKMDGSMINYTIQIEAIKNNISDIENTLVSLRQIRDKAALTFSEVDVLTQQINSSSEELLHNIASTKAMLAEVTARPPTAVAAPVKLERFKAFVGKSYLDFLMPGIIAIVLMFVCFLLASITIVQEKSKGTLLRTMLSPVSLPELLMGKTLALLVVAFLQGVILVLMAYFLFGISMTREQLLPLFEVILIYSASFIAIGMVIATFADSENTAMLSSLVLSIPMLFLCGVFYPFEMMPRIMAAFGNFLPITMGIGVFTDILIYQKAIVARDLSGLVAYFVLALTIAYLQMRRELT